MEIRNVPGEEGLLYTSAPDHVRETSPVGSGPLFPSHQEKVRQEPAFSSFIIPLPLPLLSFTNPLPLPPASSASFLWLVTLSLILAFLNPRGQLWPLLPVVCVLFHQGRAASSPRVTGHWYTSEKFFFLFIDLGASMPVIYFSTQLWMDAHSSCPLDLHIIATEWILR